MQSPACGAKRSHAAWAGWLEGSFAEQDQGVLVNNKLYMNQQCALVVVKTNSIPGWRVRVY